MFAFSHMLLHASLSPKRDLCRNLDEACNDVVTGSTSGVGSVVWGRIDITPLIRG